MTVRRSTAPCHSVGMPVLRRIGTTMLKGALAAQVWLYRRTQGRRAGSVRGTPVLLLTTTGRKSGVSRTRPIGYLPDSDRFVVCGSNGGSDHHPAWALNLRGHPHATAEVGPRTLTVTATELTGDDYETMWTRYTTAYPAYAAYRTKTRRHLPIFILQETTTL